jgi:hypothetical protein
MLPPRREILYCISTHLHESRHHLQLKQPFCTRAGHLYIVPQVILAVQQSKPIKSLLAPCKLHKLQNALCIAAICSIQYGLQPPADAASNKDRDNETAAAAAEPAADVDINNKDHGSDNQDGDNNNGNTNHAGNHSNNISGNSDQPSSAA